MSIDVRSTLIRLALRSVRARWGRVVLTALAIVASTAFLSGTFIFRDTVQRTFNALFADVFERVDAYVQSSNSVEGFLGFERRDRLPGRCRRPGSSRRGCRRRAGVRAGRRGGDRQGGQADRTPHRADLRRDGERGSAVGVAGPEGRLPSGPSEVALDTITAADGGFVLGDTVKVNAEAGSREFTLVGITVYDNIVSPGNATWALFDAPTAEAFVAKPGFVDAVLVQGRRIGAPTTCWSSGSSAALDPERRRDADLGRDHRADPDRHRAKPRLHHTVPGDLLVHRPRRGDVRDLQRVLDHGRATPTRERAAARHRCQPASGDVDAADRGCRRRPARFGRRTVRRCRTGARASATCSTRSTTRSRRVAWRSNRSPSRSRSSPAPRASLIAAIAPAIGAGRVPPVAAMADTAFERTGSVRGRVIAAIGAP